MKVSVLILTYNRLSVSSERIPTIVDSIGNIKSEVLIWDNHSKDGSYDWVLNYGRADCRVYKVFGADQNYGVEAINFLAEAARGEYILKVDDDVTVPKNFAERMVAAYEHVNCERLLYLGWDMVWGKSTFATRSGEGIYRKHGEIRKLPGGGRVLLLRCLDRFMVNGVCRLSKRDKFLELGGHPKGVIYGVDGLVCTAAHAKGYWGGFLTHPIDLVKHDGAQDSKEMRNLKDQQLREVKNAQRRIQASS